MSAFASFAGSPPPMRGIACGVCRSKAEGRITPAHAGNSSFDLYNDIADRDHPRPCGE